MDYIVEEKKKSLKPLFLVLTIVSLVFYTFSRIGLISLYRSFGTHFLNICLNMLPSFFYLCPFVILLIYILTSYNTEKGKKLISFVFMVIVSSTLFPYLYEALYLGNFYFTDGIYFYLDVFVIVPSFVVAMIYGFKGKLNKVFIIIGSSMAFLSYSMSLLENFNMMHNARYFFSPSYNLSMSNIYFCLSFNVAQRRRIYILFFFWSIAF
jgi:hypothetical protein